MKDLLNNPWDEEPRSNSGEASGTAQNFVSQLLKSMGLKGGSRKRSSHSGGNSSGEFKWIVRALLLIALIGWLSTGFFIVDQDQEGVVVRLGKYSRTSGPGLRWKFPNPIESVTKVSVTRFNKVVVGVRGDAAGNFNVASNANGTKEGQMLTADENIIDIGFFFQWRVNDAYKFLFNIRDIVDESTVRLAAESAMREVIGTTKLYDALSEHRQVVEQSAKAILQQTLDLYGAGVEIISLGISYSHVVPEVKDAYRDVQSAKADKETAINKAQAYRNGVIPRAKGDARAIIESAMSYKASRIAEAEGEGNRFQAVLEQYRKDKDIVKKKMYLEATEKVYGDANKVILETNKKGEIGGFLPMQIFKSMPSGGNMLRDDSDVEEMKGGRDDVVRERNKSRDR